MERTPIFRRAVEPKLVEALSDSPAVLLHGPRQCGKTTLAQMIGDRFGYAYRTFDDPQTLDEASEDPIGFVKRSGARAILDEVQLAPELFRTIKAEIDRDRQPGRFLLTGSANVLLLPKLSDSLAGRMSIVRLHPLSQSEIEGTRPDLFDRLFENRLEDLDTDVLGEELAARIVRGGFPAAVKLAKAERRADWYADYTESLVQRDIRDLARVRSLQTVHGLLVCAAGQTARPLNVSDLASPFKVSRITIAEYLDLLERLFIVERLRPWHTNRISRLVKTPKLHLTDTGVAAALLGLDSASLFADRPIYGQLTESFVNAELQRLASAEAGRPRFHHFRTHDKLEVDLVVERQGRRLAGVEVKAGSTVRSSDFKALRKLAEGAGKRFCSGVVLYDGERLSGFGEKLWAVPLSALWTEPPTRAGSSR